MKFKVGEMVNIPMAFEGYDAIGIIFEVHTVLNDMYAIQTSNNDWDWYRTDDIEKIVLRNSF